MSTKNIAPIESHDPVFWGEVAPCDHLLQIYESDETFLHALVGFACDGFLKGDSVVIIATSAHLEQFENQLGQDFELSFFKKTNQYIPLDAEETLDKFVIEGKVDEEKFRKTVQSILRLAQRNGRKVRAFGEMVAVLWGQGNRSATYELERLWNEFCKNDLFCLFCAFPKSGFRQDANKSIKHICSMHTKMIEKNNDGSSEIATYGRTLRFTSMNS